MEEILTENNLQENPTRKEKVKKEYKKRKKPASKKTNETIFKKNEPIQVITSLEHVKSVADGPTLLAYILL